MSSTVYDVFDNFLGESSCQAAGRLSDPQWEELAEELRRFYDSWLPLEPEALAVFPGSWVAHHFHEPHGRTLVGNDLLLFERVIVHDPIEPFVSRFTQWRAPESAPDPPDDALILSLVDVPSQRSGRSAQLITALFPPDVGAFMTVGEAYRFNYTDRTAYGIPQALRALDEWRKLVEVDAVELVPVMEITARETSNIARSAEAAIARVEEALAGDDELKELTSFDIRGGSLTPRWQPDPVARRNRARHVSWVYARELAIGQQGAALFAAEQPIDRNLLAALEPSSGVVTLSARVDAVTSVSIPGFSDVPLAEIARLRRDDATFAAVRTKLGEILRAAPADLESLPSPQRAQYLADHLNVELAALQRQMGQSSGFGAKLVSGLVNIGIPAAAGAATGGILGTGVGGLAGGVRQVASGAMQPRNPQDRAMTWIIRHLRQDELS